MSVFISPNPLEEDEVPQKAAIALNFLIVGAGLGGLVAAITLKDAGHSVLVLDARRKKQLLSESKGESFYVGPNVHRVLTKCGVVLPEQETWRAAQTAVRRYSNGELLLNLRTETEIHSQCGGGEFYVATSTLIKYLYERIIEQGIEVRFETRVVDVAAVDTAVTLDSGKKVSADIIVGADGGFSVVRKAITGEGSADRTAYIDCSGEYLSFRISKQTIREQTKLEGLLKQEEVEIYLGPQKMVCTYPLRDTEEYCIVAFSVCPHPNKCPKRRRDEIPVTDDIRNRYNDFDPIVRDLFQIPNTVTSTHWRMADCLESWVRDDGKVVLIGDAAHPTQPTSISSTPGMNLEDGAVLGTLYTHLRNRSQIPLLSQTYEDLRADRCKNALKLDLALLELGTLPDGPAQEDRDRMLKKSQEHFNKQCDRETQAFDTMWNQRVDIWKYDAWEDVADWWLRLGRISQGMMDGAEPPAAVRRLSVGVQKQVRIVPAS